jgi:hypothetical protein
MKPSILSRHGVTKASLGSAIVLFSSVLSSHGTTVLLPATEDTYTLQSEGATNFSGDPTFGFGAAAGGQAQSMLFRFDASSLAGIPGTDILSVTLNLTVSNVTGFRRGFVGALVDGNADWTNSGATWNTRNGIDAWVGAQGARTGSDSEVINPEFAVAGTETDGEVISIPLDVAGTSYGDFSELFAEWNDGSNNGMVIYNFGGLPNTGVQFFHSSEATNPSFRPQLVVETIPEPSHFLLGLSGLVLALRRRR